MGHLRKANLEDLKHVAKNMREMDKLEAFYQSGQEPNKLFNCLICVAI